MNHGRHDNQERLAARAPLAQAKRNTASRCDDSAPAPCTPANKENRSQQ